MNLGTLQIHLEVISQNANRQLQISRNNLQNISTEAQRAQTPFQKLGSTIGSLGKTIASAFVVNKIIALGKAALQAYASFEQLTGGVETLFKDSSATVLAYAENAYLTAGMSANTYMETVTSFSASLISSLAGDTAQAAELANLAITDMSDNANKMGTDLTMIQNAYQGFAKQNFTMLDNLKIGYAGSKTEMERLLKDAEKLTGQSYDVSSFSDIVQAIHAIQTQWEITGTTAKEAEGTIEGSVNRMKASWTNWLTMLGEGNVEDIQSKTEALMKSIGNVLKNALPVIGKMIISAIASVFYAIFSLIAKLGTAIGNWAKKVIDKIKQPFIAIGNFFQNIFKKIKNFFSEKFKLMIDNSPLAALINFIKKAIEWIEKLRKKFNEWKNKLKESGVYDEYGNPIIQADGSHRLGLRYVPYDNYRAILHKGERVLTQSENQKYSRGINQSSTQNVSINFNGNYRFNNKEDINYFMAEAARLTKRERMMV